jgi:uncharacterized protein YacL
MLILLLRMAFILLATIVGFKSGQFIYRDQNVESWFGGAMGFGVAVTLIAAEQAFRRHFTRSLVAFLVGLGLGLLLSFLALTVVDAVIQNKDLRDNLDVPMVLVITYLVMITVIHGADRFRVIIPFVELRNEHTIHANLVVDPEALADPRLIGLVRSGLVEQRLLIHRRAILQLEQQATGDDPTLKARARRALDGLADLRALGQPEVGIDETEIPNAANLPDVLVRLARLEGGRLVSSNPELLRLAGAEGVATIDLNTLSNAFSSPVKPGEVISVTIAKAGEGRGQGIGFLDDGSMVVVSDAADQLGQTVQCTIMRLHTTANGRMVFADRKA